MVLTDGLHSREDDANGFDSDTPRSGIATPQPDPSDKRLPGIMHSYFGQVGAGFFTSLIPGQSENSNLASKAQSGPPSSCPEEGRSDEVPSSDKQEPVTELASASAQTGQEDHPLSPNEQSRTSIAPQTSRLSLNPYPTPPASQTPSLHKLKLSDSCSEEDEKVTVSDAGALSPIRHESISESMPSHARRASLMNPLSSIVTTSNVHAAHFSNPSDRYPTTSLDESSHSRSDSEFNDSLSYDRLKKLTDDAPRKKSIPPTPTRALSSHTAKSDTSGGSDAGNGNPPKAKEEIPRVTSPAESTEVHAPAPKGKLTVKIAEARGLRKSRDPYVVAMFQKNELVSKGPMIEEGDEHEEPTSTPMGGIPISRTASDSGRPMAIPMKSRQSSNVSLSDHRDFKSKGRKSMTDPKWDTEAVL